MIVFPNAKINIGLYVVEKRNDGFHNIESVFYPVPELYDVLEIVKNEKGEGAEFTFSGIAIPGEQHDNLCVRAYQLLKNDFSISAVKIHLHKVIPIGAGLGGGSSDAAFTLKALNSLFELKLSKEQLVDYAKQLGSDCAFFIANQPVYAYNKGDDFKNIELDLSSYEIKIIYPEIHIETAEAYAGVKPKITTSHLIDIIKQPVEKWKNQIKNDFEESIFLNHPEIQQLKQKMYDEGAVYASMTGSGSAVYGFYKKTLQIPQ